MNYIVLDLEWNQNPNIRAKPNKMLPFEIIEIGAVRLDEDRQILDTFQCLIKPGVYHWIQDTIHQVTHVNYSDLQKGTPFPDAAEEFMKWCGDDFRFCTWAKQDVAELQRNMRYYYMLDLLPGPVVYLDVQKLCSLSFEDGKARRSLEYMIDSLSIKKDLGFHRALADAVYTARIFQRIRPDLLSGYESIDVYQNPKSPEEAVYWQGKGREKYVSCEYASREEIMHTRAVTKIYCPVCRSAQLDQKTGWCATGARVYQCAARCPEHGPVIGRLRLRQSQEGNYFAVRTLRQADPGEEAQVRNRLAK